MFNKNTWDTVKAFFDSMKVPLFIAVFVLLYRDPQMIRDFIDRAGFQVDKINVAGVELVQKAVAKLEGTEDDLDRVAAALAERESLLREIARTTPDEGIKARIESMLADGDAITTSALAAAGQAAIAAAEITESLQATQQATPALAPPPAPTAPAAVTGNYLIVFGADLDVASALHEIRRVTDGAPQDAGRFGLFKKGSFYRSAAIFDEQALRDANVQALAAAAGRRVEPVDVSRWCPGATPIPDADADVPVYQC